MGAERVKVWEEEGIEGRREGEGNEGKEKVVRGVRGVKGERVKE